MRPPAQNQASPLPLHSPPNLKALPGLEGGGLGQQLPCHGLTHAWGQAQSQSPRGHGTPGLGPAEDVGGPDPSHHPDPLHPNAVSSSTTGSRPLTALPWTGPSSLSSSGGDPQAGHPLPGPAPLIHTSRPALFAVKQALSGSCSLPCPALPCPPCLPCPALPCLAWLANSRDGTRLAGCHHLHCHEWGTALGG